MTAEARGQHSSFPTTLWTLVRSAGLRETESSRLALSKLCEIYWHPVYRYIRRRGNDEDQARDLTQSFFAVLLEKQYLADADQARGRFRSFLLTAVKHFLSNEFDAQRAQKRGGNLQFLSLDFQAAEERFRIEPIDHNTPEVVFERAWALTLLENTLSRMQREAGSPQFERLKQFLTGDQDRGGYGSVAAELGMSEPALRVAVHRLRKQYREALRAEIRETVDTDAQVEDEIRHLLTLLDQDSSM
jgi:DNA-directed RNA polymerase specialized sigma24 family protein